MPDGWRLLDSDPDTARSILATLGPRGDQLQAALDDQMTTMSVALRRTIGAEDILPTTTMAPWAKEALHAWEDLGLPDCRHLQQTKAPVPVWLLAWDPSELRCVKCMMTAQAATTGTTEDDTCDGCRRVVKWLTPAAATCSNLAVFGGLCDDCLKLEEQYLAREQH